jgi:hypothetical protein
MAQRRIDKERLDRADRADRIAVEAERQERIAKSARLRHQRLSQEAPNPSTQQQKSLGRWSMVKKSKNEILEVD